MKIIVDEREHALYDRLDARLSSLKTPSFAILEKQVLPLGDIVLETDEGKKVMLIERKTYTDLLASIKDGRYEEQSYRLNGLNHPNHNIIYLIIALNLKVKFRVKLLISASFLLISQLFFTIVSSNEVTHGSSSTSSLVFLVIWIPPTIALLLGLVIGYLIERSKLKS